jgi:DNA sulfur modification protein DndD
MRLLSLEVSNFRQFHGSHHVDLATNDKTNVVVIHGENGAGKTTILNAFKWCFYGETDFDTRNENLLNEQALAEAETSTSLEMVVKVEFEHEGMRHSAKRTALFKKTGAMTYEEVGDSVFALTWTDTGGAHQKSQKSEIHMNQILPEKMQPYFFFNGERIEKLAGMNAADEVQGAIKNLMGLEIVERARAHVTGPVLSRLRKEMKDTSTKELADAIENEGLMGEKIQDTRNRISQIDKNVAQYKDEVQEINRRLESIAGISAKQSERLQLEQDILDLNERLRQLKKQRLEFVSAYGGLAFAGRFIDSATTILEDKRQKGELPFKVKEQFITDLLEKEKCICDRELLEGTPAHTAVNAFRRSTTSADIEDAFIETSGALVQMARARNEIFSKLTAFQTDEANINSDIASKIDRIEVLSNEIGQNRDSEDIAKLENRRGELNNLQNAASEEKGRHQGELKDWESRLGELTKERERLSAQSEKNQNATKRFALAEEVKRVLDAFYAALANKVRTELSSTVDDTFRRIMRKQYWAEIDGNYTLQIFKEIGGEKQLVYEKSTGESQITSLSFIASIVQIAKSKAGSRQNFVGGVFPIVMDSPFGALDPDYRKKVAEFIPQLADQVIVLVSKSQWSKEVEDQVRPRMAHEYTLRYFTPRVTDGTDLNKAHASERFEHTNIEEGHHVG